MRRVLTMAGALFLFGCATSFAQVAPARFLAKPGDQ